MNLILFGFKGCGKSYYGKRLAEKLHRPFVDTDLLIEELYVQEKGESLTVREIYRKEGEEAFCALEKRALLQLSGLADTIIALGSEAILDPENQEILRKLGDLVYLQASMQTLKRRMLYRELPAVLQNEIDFNALYGARLPLYESIPAHRIDVDLLDEPAVIAALRNILIFEEPTLPL